MKYLSDVCAAWLGAMIEAEGSAYVRETPGRPAASIQFCNTDPELISVALRLTQIGTVQQKFHSSPLSRKLILWWRVECWLDALAHAQQLAPYSPKVQTLMQQMEEIDRAA